MAPSDHLKGVRVKNWYLCSFANLLKAPAGGYLKLAPQYDSPLKLAITFLAPDWQETGICQSSRYISEESATYRCHLWNVTPADVMSIGVLEGFIIRGYVTGFCKSLAPPALALTLWRSLVPFVGK